MKYFKKLTGKTVYLSPLNPEDEGDLEVYTKWINDLSVSVGLGSAAGTYNLKSERSFLEDLARGGHLYAIILMENDELIGNCSLFGIDHINRTASTGLFIGEKKCRSKGYGTEAVQLIVEYGFRILNLNNIMLKVFEFNKPAIRCYEKAGFAVFGRRKASYLLNGIFYDELFMEILAGDLKTSFLDKTLTNSGLQP